MKGSIFGIGFILCVLQAQAQSPGELLNVHDYQVGNPQPEQSGAAIALDIIQDKRGFMWFATTKGLIRYDGVNYRHYYHQPEQPHSLGGNNVKEIRESATGELYLALNDAGMSRFNPNAPTAEAFTNYSHDPKKPSSIPTNVLYALEIDQQGIVWMGGKNSGLIRFDPRRQTFTTYQWPVSFNQDLERSVYDILADPDGSLWIGTSSSGLLRYWPNTGRFEQYSLRSMISPVYSGRNGTGSLYIDTTTQTVWFGSIALGPCRLNKRTKQIIPLRQWPAGQTLFECSMEIIRDDGGVFWVLDRAHGLYKYQPQTQTLTPIPFTTDPGKNEWFDCAYLDRTGMLWVSTGKGVVRYRQASEQSVRFYPIQNRARHALTGSKRVEQDQRGDYWLEFADHMARYDTTLRAVVETIPFPPDVVRSGLIRIQVVGRQVFLYTNNILYVLNDLTRKIEPLLPKKDQPALGSAQDRNWRLLPDTIAGQPILWIGTFEHGLLRYKYTTHQIEHIPLGKGEWTAQNTEAIWRDHQKTIWIATNGQGLFRLTTNQTSTQFLARPDDRNALPDNEVMDLLEDHRGTIWAATLTHGLVRINQQNGRVSFTTFAAFPNGPPSRIFSFFEDARHLFWVTTGDGLYLFNPQTGRFLKYLATDQVVFPHDHNTVSHSPDGYPLTLTNNHILKGSDAGSLFAIPRNPPLHFTDFRLFNQSHPELLNDTAGGIQLEHQQNGFSIQFAAPWFRHPEQIRYRYQLVGFDPNWIESDTRREAFYTNIPTGEYTFVVQASWDGTDHFLRTISLPIVVSPAYWETWWFRGITALLMGLTGWAVWSYRRRETQLKANLLLAQSEKQQREVELREHDAIFQRRLADTEMAALRSQMNPHFIFNCLNSVKLYTLQNNTDKASDYLTKFARLIRLVLENSRAEHVTLQDELEALQLYLELEAMRFKEKVQFCIRVAPGVDLQFLSIPPLLVQPYVENAIWHGLMHRPEGGTVTVTVNQPADNLLHIEITDDGIGRQQAMALKSKSAGKHKSFGMQVTADRIRMINQLYNTKTNARIMDLVDSFGEPCGTKVILEIPV